MSFTSFVIIEFVFFKISFFTPSIPISFPSASESIRVTENGSELFYDFPKELRIKS